VGRTIEEVCLLRAHAKRHKDHDVVLQRGVRATVLKERIGKARRNSTKEGTEYHARNLAAWENGERVLKMSARKSMFRGGGAGHSPTGVLGRHKRTRLLYEGQWKDKAL
jgi:hypothetical protein